MHHSRIVLSVGGSVWYMIRNLHCTVTIDSVLANSKTERFLIHCEHHFSSRLPPSGGTWKYAKTPSTKKKLGEILYLLICSFLPCLSWLLRSRVRKSRRDLWITLYCTRFCFPEERSVNRQTVWAPHIWQILTCFSVQTLCIYASKLTRVL